MALFSYPDPESQSPEVRERLARMGSLNVTRMMSHSEPAMLAYSKMGTALLLKGALDPVLREVVILRIGQLCNSEYEWHQHVSVGRAVGMDEATIQALADQDFGQLSPEQHLGVRIAEQIHGEGIASEATMREAAEIFSPAELVELCLVAGYYIMTAGFLRSFAIEIEDTPPLGDSMAAGRPAGQSS